MSQTVQQIARQAADNAVCSLLHNLLFSAQTSEKVDNVRKQDSMMQISELSRICASQYELMEANIYPYKFLVLDCIPWFRKGTGQNNIKCGWGGKG